MADTKLTVAVIAVIIQIIYAAKLTKVNEHPLDKESPASAVNLREAISKILKARDTKHLRQGNESPLKRNSDHYMGSGCYDNHMHCESWANSGECFNNQVYMEMNCQYSCGFCCIDYDSQCGPWAAIGECYNNPEYMMSNCPMSCGSCSNNYGGDYYNRRDVKRDFGHGPPGTKDVETSLDSGKQRSNGDKLRRAYDFGNFFNTKETMFHTNGNDGPQRNYHNGQGRQSWKTGY